MYYPKSQITPNLYTNGDEFVSSIDNSSYSGYYFKTSTGKYFTGRNQDDRPNVELIIATALSQDTNTTPNPNININVLSLDNTDFLSNQYEVNTDEVLNYFTLKNINIYDPPKTLIPTYNPVLPTQQDYQNGEFRRLFAKKTNEIQYVEIDQDTFAKLLAKDPQILWQLYEPFDLTWYLTGNIEDVARINFNTVELATLRKKLPMLGEYLKFNYIKYYNKWLRQMFWLIETQEQIQHLIESNSQEAFIEIIPYHDKIHPALNDVSLVYYRPSNDTKGYMLCIDHSETLSVNKTLVNELLTGIKALWVRDKKNALYYFQIKGLRDLSILTPPYIQDQTPTHTYFQNKYPDYTKINRVIPVSKHYEVCEHIYNKVKPQFTNDLPAYFDFYNNKTTLAFFGIEKNGIKIDEEQFYKYLKPINPLYSIADGRVYTNYNLFTTTRRPSNSFNGINFAALNKDNGARGSFISSHGFVELDISAYHPHLASRLVAYDFGDVDVHQAFADLYGTSYKEAKELTFKQLYGGVFKEYEHLEFFQQVKKFIDNNWKDFNNLGQVIVPGSGYCFKKSELENMNPQKLFNYILQNVETSTNVCILMEIHKLLRGKNTKLVLYTYDSFLFDYDESENLIDDIKQIFKNKQLQIKIGYGTSYDFQ